MFDRLDIDNINKKVYHVGVLTPEIINILSLDIQSANICISDDKITYTKKHESKFKDYSEYKKCIEETSNIIANPDYVAVHPNGNSIEYIKKIDQVMLVAVRVKNAGTLWIKSIFPITESKLAVYIKTGSAKKVGLD